MDAYRGRGLSLLNEMWRRLAQKRENWPTKAPRPVAKSALARRVRRRLRQRGVFASEGGVEISRVSSR